MKIKCLTCPKEITLTNLNKTKLYCSGKCQREMNNYKKGKKKKEEVFEDLRGRRKYSIKKKKEIKRKKKTTWKKYRYYIDKPIPARPEKGRSKK